MLVQQGEKLKEQMILLKNNSRELKEEKIFLKQVEKRLEEFAMQRWIMESSISFPVLSLFAFKDETKNDDDDLYSADI
eukprot:7505550-Ditylum_brightwellii.AAC.1